MSPRQSAVQLLRAAGAYHPLRDLRRDWRFRRLNRAKLREWSRAGKPLPAPDLLKYDVLRAYAQRYKLLTLVETGTFYGNAIFTLRGDFKEIHSIELAPGLYELNRRELGHLRHIHLHHGDSAVILPQLLPKLTSPTLFWLDGHFCSGPSARGSVDTPISAELEFLLEREPAGHVILIDDARFFVGADGYPTISALRSEIARRRPTATFEVDLDIIRIAPV
jgi:hypothetical protein